MNMDSPEVVSAVAILDAATELQTHVAYCKAHWPLARPGDTYKNAGQPCTMPHAHRISFARCRAIYSACTAITNTMVGE